MVFLKGRVDLLFFVKMDLGAACPGFLLILKSLFPWQGKFVSFMRKSNFSIWRLILI